MKYFNTDKVPVGLLCLFTLKLLALNTWSYPEALVLLALVIVSSIFKVKAQNDEISEIKNLIKSQHLEIQELRTQNEAVKSTVTGFKLAQNVKQQQVNRF